MSFAAEKRRRARRSRGLLGWRVLSLVLVLGAWQLATSGSSTPASTPSPTTIVIVFAEKLADREFWMHLLASTLRVSTGFVLALACAVPIGFLMGWYRSARGLAEPWIQFLRTIPPIALIPLVIQTLGIDEDARVFLIFLASFLTIVIAVYQGVRNVEPILIKAARVLGANDTTIFFDVIVPATLPYTFVGMRIGLGAAWSTLVAAELVAADSGLAYLTQLAATHADLATMIVAIVTIGITGLAFDRAVLALERSTTRWQERIDR